MNKKQTSIYISHFCPKIIDVYVKRTLLKTVQNNLNTVIIRSENTKRLMNPAHENLETLIIATT